MITKPDKYCITIFVSAVVIFSVIVIIQRFNNNPKIILVNKKIKNGNTYAYTIVPFCIVVDKTQEPNNQNPEGYITSIKHEMCHWRQFQKEGFWKFKLKYMYYNIKYGYDKNPYEIEARKASGEIY